MNDKYGTVIKKALVNADSDSPARISLIFHRGKFRLGIRSMWYDVDGNLRYGHGVRLLVDDGTTEKVLGICRDMLVRPKKPEASGIALAQTPR